MNIKWLIHPVDTLKNWGVRKYVLGVVNKALKEKKDSVGKAREIVRRVIYKTENLLAFFRGLDDKLLDNRIDEDEAEDIVKDAINLAENLTAKRSTTVTVRSLCLWLTLALLCGGCLDNKASHQNGLIFYYSAPATLGVGYGETEDLPRGCRYRREVTQTSPALWGSGTNFVRTVTEWDTTGMVQEIDETTTDNQNKEKTK